MNKLISIVVPVYNSSAYLKYCIESILKQKYDKYELLLINDGSTDNSLTICREYEKKYIEKIRVIDKKNEGVSIARNMGIEQSKGEFVCFVDSDDYISENYLLNFIENFYDENQLVCCDCVQFSSNDKIIVKNEGNKYLIFDKKNRFDILYTNFAGYSVNKFFKRQILIENNIRFDSKIKMCEDFKFCFEYLKYVDSVKCLKNVNYFYRTYSQSASKNLKNINWFTIFNTYDYINNYLYLCSDNFINQYYFMYRFYLCYGKYRIKFLDNTNNLKKIKNYLFEKNKIIKKKYSNFNLKQKFKLFMYSNFYYLLFKIKK